MISIVIPTYEQQGHGPKMLHRLLKSIAIQRFNGGYEIVISDNSKHDSIKRVCDLFPGLPIKHEYNHKTFGVSNNTNAALDRAIGNKIKIMYMDDMFMTTSALSLFDIELDKAEWCISNSIRIDERDWHRVKQTAAYDPNQFEKNITGMPSVVGFWRNNIRFDPRFHTYCDLWFYRQLYDRYGMPAMIREYIIGQRLWKYSASRTLPATHAEDRLLIQSILKQNENSTRDTTML